MIINSILVLNTAFFALTFFMLVRIESKLEQISLNSTLQGVSQPVSVSIIEPPVVVDVIPYDNFGFLVGIVGVLLTCAIVYSLYSSVSEDSIVKVMSLADKKLSQFLDNTFGATSTSSFVDKNTGISMILEKTGSNHRLKILDLVDGSYKNLLNYSLDLSKNHQADLTPVVEVLQSESYNAAWSFFN